MYLNNGAAPKKDHTMSRRLHAILLFIFNIVIPNCFSLLPQHSHWTPIIAFGMIMVVGAFDAWTYYVLIWKPKQDARKNPTRPSHEQPINATLIIPDDITYFGVHTMDKIAVRRAYIQMCKKYHPDVVSVEERPYATQKMQEIHERYHAACAHLSTI